MTRITYIGMDVQSEARRIFRFDAVHTEHAAFFMDTHLRPSRLAFTKPTNSGWGLLGRLLNSGWY